MIITRTPLRISLLGGGTDYPDYFLRHGGQTLGLAIDKYSYVTVSRLADLFDYSLRVSYARTELVDGHDKVEHPAVRECLRFLELHRGVQIHYVGDLPARTGLGSSSSFTVGLLHALHAFKGEFVRQSQLCAEAVLVEQHMIKERVGVQDQHICAHGGIVHLQIRKDGAVSVNPISLTPQRAGEFHSHLMLMYTGMQRFANDILDEQLERTRDGTIVDQLHELRHLVDQGLEVLRTDASINVLGEILHTAWMVKRGLSSKISNERIDRWYSVAREAGASGGKLLGAGGGGFLLLIAPPDRHQAIRQALPELRPVSFRIDHAGSTVLFSNPTC